MALTKGRLPFPLGTTSYIIPDDILPNLHYLCSRVDDVELVLFESDEISNLPTPHDVTEMSRLGRETGLTYTVHLPLDTRLGSPDESRRTASVGKCRRIIECIQPAQPFAWILHLHSDQLGDPPSDNLPRWIGQTRRSLAELLNNGPDPHRVCIETLDYRFDRIADLVETFDLSVCLDIGHLLVNGRDVAAHLDRWWERARVFHVHGVAPDGSDHAHIGHLPGGLLEDVAERLAALPREDRRVVTMEIFGEEDFKRSLNVVRERLAKWLS
jgi:sugar phosphate isomerase/epimerase